MGDVHVLLWAFVGGLTPDLIRIVKARHGRAPAYLNRGFFWTSVVLLSMLGVLAAWLMKAATPTEAFGIGFAAPEVLSRLAAVHGADREMVDDAGGLRKWWAI